jgi:PAS domain S-box-containing protein
LTHSTIPASHWSVRKFLLSLVFVCLLPGIIGAAVLFLYQYQHGRTQQEEVMVQTARALSQAVDSRLRRSLSLGQALATHDSLSARDYARFHARARELLALPEMGSNIVVRDSNGRQMVNTAVPFGDPLPVTEMPGSVRRVFATGAPAISDLFIGLPLKRPIMSINVPVTINGKVDYVLGVGLLPKEFDAILKAQELPSGWVAAILDSSGTIVGRSRTPEKYIGNKATPSLLEAVLKSPEGIVSSTTQEGTLVMTAFSRSHTTGWSVAIGIPKKSLAQSLIVPLYALASGIAALFGIGLVLAWFMGNRIARSIKSLTAPAMALGSGGAVRIPRVHLREAAEVGLAIARAAELLQERSNALEARKNELAQAHTLLRNVIDSSPALIYLNDLEGNLLLVNKTYERLFGTGAANGAAGNRQPQPASSPKRFSAAALRDLSSGKIIRSEEEMHTSEGVKYYAVHQAALRDLEGKATGVCAVAVDITSLKVAEARIRVLVETLEKRVEQRTDELNQANAQLLNVNRELKEANEQLEAFSYSVAHDLRAPLRSIQGFSDALAEDYNDTLESTALNYLQRITKAAARLELLIDDLLSYSRLARMELPLSAVSLDRVIGEVMANLGVQLQETGAAVDVAPELPFVRANKAACMQIFQNLMSNAVKFARPGVQPSIRIWAETWHAGYGETTFARIWIEDNGIGIPREQLQRIFKPFERLHGMSEYPGSGIGLAVVDKTVRRMGGRCGVESEVNAGSRFWVELPLEQ